MKIKQDPITGLRCREDGAVLMPPSGTRYAAFRWTFGSNTSQGYRQIRFHGKIYKVHQIVCRAFHGLAPIDRPEVDHINRIKSDNRPENLRWVDHKENIDNRDCVDQSMEKYGVRHCEDEKAYGRAYSKAYIAAHHKEHNARQRVYDAAKYTKMKAQGLTYRKDPNGKWGWYPRVRKSEVV